MHELLLLPETDLVAVFAYSPDEDIVRLLEAGINVVTILPYHYMALREEAHGRIEAAAQRGDASFFATGMNPGFIFERVVLTLSGVSNAITEVSLSE